MPPEEGQPQSTLPLYNTPNSPPPPSSTSVFSPLALILCLIFAAEIIIKISSSSTHLLATFFVFLALLPTFFFARLILRSFPDAATPPRFLFSQFLIAAVPLILIILVAELLFLVISLLPIFFYLYTNGTAGELLNNIADSIPKASGQGSRGELSSSILKQILAIIPLPLIILVIILIAFLSAGLVEELGKWLVSRRYKSHDQNPSTPCRISARGILACACMSGLGFATTENVGYALMSLASSQTEQSPPSLFFLSLLVLFRGVLAYVVHVGTQLYVAVAAAHWYLFNDGSVTWALVQAILFHGLFDTVSFLAMAFIQLELFPAWVGLVVPFVDIALAGGLALLVRARYKALLERESAVGGDPPAPEQV